MADSLPNIDTSSYPRPQAGTGVLDTVGKLQGLEQQSIAIDQNKLNLVNDRWKITNRELQGLMGDPDVDFNKVAGRFQNLVNLGLIPPQMMAQTLKDVPTEKAKIPDWLKMHALQGQSIVDALNSVHGAPGLQSQGQQLVPTRTGVFVKGGVQRDPSGVPIQIQAPPTAEITDTNQTLPNGQPNPGYGSRGLLGPQAEQPTPGMQLPVARPPGAPQAAARPVTAPVNPSPLPVGNDMLPDGSGRSVGPNLSPSQRVSQGFPAPSGISTGMPPLFEEGKKKFDTDQTIATQKLTALKPLINALDLVKDLRSGPGTETWNKAVAFGKANGIIPITANDPTAIYQEANKYFNNYIQQSGTRSDAALAQSEISNPSVSQQIQPALEKLTRKQIARDRIEAARTGSFKDDKGNQRNDFQNYGSHASNFPAKMDEQAFILDKLPPEEKQKLLADMTKKANKGDKTAIRFFKSLETAKRSGVFQ